jgi:transposase-like protein
MGTMQVTPKEIKDQILKRIKEEGIPAAQAARDAGIPDQRVYNWLSRGVTEHSDRNTITMLNRKIEGLYAIIGKLTTELEVFKKKKGNY